MQHFIETDRLRLLACDLPIVEAFMAGHDALERHLGVRVHPGWVESGGPTLRWVRHEILKPGGDVRWWCYLPIHREHRRVIGVCGYKGEPDETGGVEIGYEICMDYRKNGLASEAAQALVANAFLDDRVKSVRAHTQTEESASTRILRKCGMQFEEETHDPDDGQVWQWAVCRDSLERNRLVKRT